MRRYSIVLSVLLLQGCSFMFASGPPSGHETLRYFDCNSNAAAPATDGFFGGTYGLVLLIGASNAKSRDETSFVAAAAGLSAVFLASMIYGIVECGSCSRAKAQLRNRLTESDLATSREILELKRQLQLQQSAPQSSTWSIEPAPAPALPATQQAPAQQVPAPEAPAPSLPVTPTPTAPAQQPAASPH